MIGKTISHYRLEERLERLDHPIRVTPTGGAAYTLTRDVYIPEPGATVPVSLGGR